MKSFKKFLFEQNEVSDDVVDLHLGGHFGSGKSTALKKANLGDNVFLIDLDDIDEELQKIHGDKPSTEEGMKDWHEKFKDLYSKKVKQGKSLSKPIVVVGHHWENGRKFAPVNARERIYIDIPKQKLFKQRIERDSQNSNLTPEYLEREYEQTQRELNDENYQKLQFDDVVKKLRDLE